MKIAILGAGAMGSLYASYLSEINEVTMLDSYGPMVDKINSQGIIKLEPDGSEKRFRAKAILTGTDIGVQDLVIVFVKSIHTYEAVKENAGLIGDSTIVMTLQNGAGNNRDIANFVEKERIIVGTSSHNSVGKGLGRIYHSGNGPTNIGPDEITEKAMERVEMVADNFRACGLEVNVVENIQRVLWSKLFVNCGINAMTAIMDSPIGDVYTNSEMWNICKRVVYETVMVAEADGTFFHRDEALELVRKVAVNDATGYSSMWQDRHNKRRTEIDKINGTVVALGYEYQIDTTYNKMLVNMMHAIEQSYLKS